MVLEERNQLQGGRYVIEKVLGHGGFGTIYKALHVQLNHQVVIKIPSDQYSDLFSEEIKILAKLSEAPHPNIVRARDAFMEKQTPCLVMDLIPGESLYKLVNKRGVLPESEAIECIRQIAEALVEVHRKGIVHRDVNPKNIIWQRNGKVTLIDFGIARRIDFSSPMNPNTGVEEDLKTNQNDSKEFTEEFAPYEQRIGKRDCEPTVDVYSLAASLYYLVTGKYPTDPVDRELYGYELESPKKHIASISDQLNQAILRGLALKAKDRPQSIQDWLKLLPASTHDPQVKRIPSLRKRWIKWNPFSLIFSHSLPHKIPSVELISDIGINYEPLEKLLLEQNWREADRETATILLKILNREVDGWLRLEDIEKIPCRDLDTINQLWVEYSDGRFGFTVQKQIWERVGGSTEANDKIWKRFGNCVGWYFGAIGWTSTPVRKLWINCKRSIWNYDNYWEVYIYDWWDWFKIPPALLINLLIFLAYFIFNTCVFIYVMFSLLLMIKAGFSKGYFPTIIQPGKGMIIGQGTQVALNDMKEELSYQRQGIARAIASSARIEQQYSKFQNEANTWAQQAQLAESKGDKNLAQEALKRQQNFTERAKMILSRLDKISNQVGSEKSKLTILKNKISYIEFGSYDWAISSLSSRLEKCDIS